MKNVASLLILLLSFSQQLQSFPNDKVFGGYKKCKVYEYNFKFGEIVKISKNLCDTYFYNSAGNITDNFQCFRNYPKEEDYSHCMISLDHI